MQLPYYKNSVRLHFYFYFVILVKMDQLFEIDGRKLYYGFLAGTFNVIRNQQDINKINVFPVPDGDTGTNMAATMRHIIDQVKPHPSFKKTADSIAVAALDGARGNSGIIFAQFLHGFNEKVQELKGQTINVKKFAATLKNALSHAYKAIDTPVEGTIITVLREWADYIDSIKETLDDFFKLFPASLEVAQKALKKTPQQLSILKRFKVVDAGGQGFVYFLEGITEFFKEPNLKKYLIFKSAPITEEHKVEVVAPEHLSYRFCTEALLQQVEQKPLEKETIRDAIKDLGDSLVIAGGVKKRRVHIHTDQPTSFFYALKDFGSLTFQKVDDMVKQYDVVHRRKWNIALVTDSSCDLPKDILDRFQIHQVPINLHFGSNNYLDKVTITPKHFYSLLDQSPQFPTSSQPNITTFRNLYSHLSAHYDSVIALHLSHQMSGT
jgi:fatty acid kinase/fatty acid kinase fatty acid binding subunit